MSGARGLAKGLVVGAAVAVAALVVAPDAVADGSRRRVATSDASCSTSPALRHRIPGLVASSASR